MSLAASPQHHWRLASWFPSMSQSALDRLHLFNLELIKANSLLHLVSTKSLPHADMVHFSDSLLSFEPVYKKINVNKPLHDLGSVNGFPGMVIGLAYPDVQVHIVESDPRRCEFLRRVAALCEAKNISIIPLPAEGLEEDTVEQAVIRSSLTMSKAFLSFRKIFKKEGHIYFSKSSEWVQEISAVPSQLCSVWEPSLFHEYKLPTTQSTFYVVVAKKII